MQSYTVPDSGFLGVRRYRAEALALTPEQVRAARFLLGWTATDLAQASLVAPRTIRRFENGEASLRIRTDRDIARALEEAGISFESDEPGEFLVRLRDGTVVKVADSAG